MIIKIMVMTVMIVTMIFGMKIIMNILVIFTKMSAVICFNYSGSYSYSLDIIITLVVM